MGFSTLVNIYATSFAGNSAKSGKGGDIYNDDYNLGTFIHGTCPPPYSAITPKKGKEKKNKLNTEIKTNQDTYFSGGFL